MKKVIGHLAHIIFLLVIPCAAFSGWNPEYLDNVDLSLIKNSNYAELKNKMLFSLEGTWCSQEKATLLMDLTALTKPDVCVEVGAGLGYSLAPVGAALELIGNGTVYAIDAWSNEIATRYWSDDDPNKGPWSTVDMEAIHNIFQNTVATWNFKDRCVEIPLPSEEAAFCVDKIDFLHFDGDYSERGALEDVMHYLPRVKSGGYVLLSNIFTAVNGKLPKMKAFVSLLEACEVVCEIEEDNVFLLKKP